VERQIAAPRTAVNTVNGTQAALDSNGEIFYTLRETQVLMARWRIHYGRSGRTAPLNIDHAHLKSSYSERNYQGTTKPRRLTLDFDQ
jgi:hypothetical protein